MALSKLEVPAAKGEDDLLKFVKDETGRSSSGPVKRLWTRNSTIRPQPVPHGLPGR